MRILIDLQALQTSGSANRGIGRYSRGLVEAMLRQTPDDHITLLLNGMIGADNLRLRRGLLSLRPDAEVRVWTAAPPVSCPGNEDNRLAAEAIREAVIASCSPDVVLVTSLFEGLHDDAVTGIGVVPTAVVLYDLIPLIHPEIYLTHAGTGDWYRDRVLCLKSADCLLTISDGSARDAVRQLDIDPERVVSIGSDVDPMFRPDPVSAETRARIGTDLGFTRPCLLYTGGIDHRKNIDRLIEAFAALPPEVRDAHQLGIVCRVEPAEKARLMALAHTSGLPDDGLILTGFVPDDMLVALYRHCAAFVFPSLYEGFGLPVLEAMRCGAAVIGANASSTPEVIGREDALFDPLSVPAMTGAILRVLTDDAFRQSLRDHAPVQAARFDWNDTAARALGALRALAARPPPATVTLTKPRLAFVSPLPPERSGISFYAAELLPHLARYYDIDLIVAQDRVDGLDRFPTRSVDWFRANARSFDRVLYQFGNSGFHLGMFDLVQDIPGTVVLHDFYLSGAQLIRGHDSYTRLLAEDHGYGAVRDSRSGERGIVDSVLDWPANGDVLRAAAGVIVHSSHPRALAERFFGPGAADDWCEIPLLRVIADLSEADRIAARERLGIAPDALLICSFGAIGRNKPSERLIDGFAASATAKTGKARLVFAGEAGEDKNALAEVIATRGLDRIVTLSGWVADAEYRDYLQAADIAVQLRSASRGESSAAVLDAQTYRVPVIVNAHGSLADLSPDTVCRIPDAFGTDDLARAIDALADDPQRRKTLAEAGRRAVEERHAPEVCAGKYRDCIERNALRTSRTNNALVERLAALPADFGRDIVLAQAVSDSLPLRPRVRQLFVDVTGLSAMDHRTGIQRVVRAILMRWLKAPPPGWKVEPVWLDPTLERYRYSRKLTCRLLDIASDWTTDAPVDWSAGDHFINLDLNFAMVPHHTRAMERMGASGVASSFVVYDLLPVTMPQMFPSGSAPMFAAWIALVARADHAVCISQTTADDLRDWLRAHHPGGAPKPRIGWFHMGADLASSQPSSGIPPDAGPVLEALAAQPTFLMVGTVEPRKGHIQTVAAFERLWRDGGDATLVIVGKQGWNMETLVGRLRSHGELGRRLFWLEGISDEYLERIYGASDCLIAASEGEGFGLPLIEAAQIGLPILARDIPVFREVAGDHAAYFDGTRPEVLTEAIEAWLRDDAEGRTIGPGDLPWITWRQSADDLLRAIGIDPAPGDAG